MGRYWLQTLGCPKNQVDSDKLEGHLAARGYRPAAGPDSADLVVVNTCAFIEAARQESIDAVLELADQRAKAARLVVTGCMAERYGDELIAALPEVDLVAGFGQELIVPADPPPVPVTLGATRRTGERAGQTGGFDLLELPRPATRSPWAYVKVAEGCDRLCGFCAIPSFRGKQRSRSSSEVLAEVDALAAGQARRRAALARGGPGGPGPRLLRSRPHRTRTGHSHRARTRRPSPPSPARWRPGWHGPDSSTSIHPA